MAAQAAVGVNIYAQASRHKSNRHQGRANSLKTKDCAVIVKLAFKRRLATTPMMKDRAGEAQA